MDLVLPAGGMGGRVIQKRLWNLNKEVHSIELGSMVDVLDDLKTRSWMTNKKDKVALKRGFYYEHINHRWYWFCW